MNLSFIPEDMDWVCQPCGERLVPGMVNLEYLGSSFRVELPICPHCRTPLISEDLATGRMFEVEQLLEDK